MFGDFAVLLGITEPSCGCPYQTADPERIRRAVRAVFEDLFAPHMRGLWVYDRMFQQAAQQVMNVFSQMGLPVPTGPSGPPALESVQGAQQQAQQAAVLQSMGRQLQGLGQMFQQLLQRGEGGGGESPAPPPGQEVQQTAQQQQQQQQQR